jgi:hypothetical protein
MLLASAPRHEKYAADSNVRIWVAGVCYTSGALDGYEEADVAGLLEDRVGKAREA